MRIWLYYLKDDNDFKIHAFTADREINRKFEKERDMTKFFRKTIDMKNSKYESFAIEYSDLKIQKIPIRTTNKGMEVSTYILSNMKEWGDTVDSMMDFIWKISDSTFDSSIMNKKYYSALRLLLFPQIYRLAKERESDLRDYLVSPYYNSYGSSMAFIIEDFMNSYKYDELKFYLNLYKHTYRKIKRETK